MVKQLTFVALAIALGACSKKKNETATDNKEVTKVPSDSAPDGANAQKTDPGGKGSGLTLEAIDGNNCSVANLRAVRAAANAKVKAGDAKTAVAFLEKLECPIDFSDEQPKDEQSEYAWLISDLAFAHYKAGNPSACYELAAPHLAPYPGNAAAVLDEGAPVLKALEHNLSLCSKARMTSGAFAGFESVPCSLAEDAFGLPKKLLDEGEEEACFFILPGELGDDGYVGGGYQLLKKTKKGVQKTLITEYSDSSDDGAMSSHVCNTEEVAFAKKGGKLQLLFSGGGRDCDGGTAADDFLVVWSLEGTQLKLVAQSVAGLH